MTSSVPPEAWDDRRLEAAFAARASSRTMPTDLVDATVEGLHTTERPAAAWRRWLPAAAVVVLAIGVAAGGLALSDQVVGRHPFGDGPSPDLKTLDNGAFAFEYPATWIGYDASAVGSGVSAVAVLSTAPVEKRCGNERHVDINCVYEQRLEAGQVRLFVLGGAYRGETIQDRPDIENGTTTRTVVGGMPAIFDDLQPGADSYYREDEALHWEIAVPGTDGTNVVRLEALLTEPGVAEARAQLEALVASFRFINGPDPSTPPTPEPTATATPPRLADLRVLTVEELIEATASPTAEEVIVRGWLARSSAVFDCNIELDPHPLVPHCEDFGLFLMAGRTQVDPERLGPAVLQVVPMLGVDAHIGVPIIPGAAVEVMAIGHLLDHRWTTCPADAQDECKRRFVIDWVAPANQSIDDEVPIPWALPADFPKDQPSEPIDVLRSIVGGVSVVSIGNADANGVRSIEPLVDEVNNEQGAWVIRALVGGDATPTVRTFLVGHIGWWTVFEVSEAAVIDRTPPLEGAPTPVPSDEPARTFPPAGSIVVFLPKDGGFEPSKIRAALVDLSGRVTGVRAPRPNEPRLIANAGGGRGALLPDPTVPDRYQLVWSGGICDKDMIVTIDATFSKVVVDSPLPGDCDSIAQEHRLVLDIDGAVSPPAVEVRYAETSAGAS